MSLFPANLNFRQEALVIVGEIITIEILVAFCRDLYNTTLFLLQGINQHKGPPCEFAKCLTQMCLAMQR